MAIGIVAVVVVAAIAAAFFLGRKSDEDKTATTPTATQTTPTATTPTPTQTEAVTVTNVQTITQVDPQPGVGVEIVEQSINPTTVAQIGPIALTVRTKGDINTVKMDISGPAPMVVELVRGPTVSDITTWAAATTAPAQVGNYAYKAIVNATDGAIKEGPDSPLTVTP